jgi:hypothetical protein
MQEHSDGVAADRVEALQALEIGPARAGAPVTTTTARAARPARKA